ncbi:MAG: hypothetical protein MI753_12425 [Hyphomicrobiales bacterium]|nr:hypothetical protein [Hyphomicrobiales bacterium]
MTPHKRALTKSIILMGIALADDEATLMVFYHKMRRLIAALGQEDRAEIRATFDRRMDHLRAPERRAA